MPSGRGSLLAILALLLLALTGCATAPDVRIGAYDCHHVKRDGIRGLECGHYLTQDDTGIQIEFDTPVKAWPLVVVNGRAVFAEYPALTDHERARMVEWYLPGVIDPKEEQAIARLCGSAVADGVSTAMAMTCAGVREANPWLGAHASLPEIAVYTWIVCKHAKWDASKTHKYESSAGYINFMAGLRSLATLNNLGVISKASGCL